LFVGDQSHFLPVVVLGGTTFKTATSDAARVTRQTETNAVRSEKTAAHLSTLSTDLLELVGAGRR
jgi:hypothetical protein